MRFLIDHGIDVNTRDWDAWNCTPLIMATAAGRKKAVNYLLERGTDISAMDSDGMSALSHTHVNRGTAIVRILKKAGATD
jgi:ankyrin repeat protein